MELTLNLILTFFGVFFAINIALLITFVRKYQAIKSSFYSFITSTDENTPSPFAQVFDTLSHTAGHAIAMEVKTTIMGKMSGDARLEKAIASDIAKDQLEANHPLASGLLEQFPSLKKRAIKNPAVLEFLANMIDRLPKNSQGQSNWSAGNGHSNYKERLGRYA